jgi:hypothetical protein
LLVPTCNFLFLTGKLLPYTINFLVQKRQLDLSIFFVLFLNLQPHHALYRKRSKKSNEHYQIV